MNIFDQLGKIYNEIDTNYASIEVNAHSQRHFKKESEYAAKRQLNDQAYFLFMFTRLEGRVNDLSNTLIGTKVATSDWKAKRTWDILKRRGIPFMERVTLLVERNGNDYNLIKDYYEQRNFIAHGGSFTIVISIPTVITDMKRLYKDLRNN